MFINQNKNSNHTYFMKLALSQAENNLGSTEGNPSVGCIITRNNSVISAGHTSLNGRPHAEFNAIINSRSNLKGSTIYVTMEPCCNYGKTPPCTKLIINRKIKKVFFSINDPDIRSHNMSNKQFTKKKIYVKKGICANESESFYRSYIKSKHDLLPFVTCKLAVSKDFFTINKKKKWITNEFSRSRVQLMRTRHDCIITSSNTIILDNPSLTCRINGLQEMSPSRIILDNKLRIPLKSKIIKDAYKYHTIIFFNKLDKIKINALRKMKLKTFRIPVDFEGNLDLQQVLIKARKLGFYRIFLECGMTLANNFLYNNHVDDLNIFISSKNLGDLGKFNFKKYFKLFKKGKHFTTEKVNLYGDKLIRYKIK